MTRSGIVAVVGKPNAGKSTLLNRIIGQKLSITSEKPQSTRDRIVGIHTANDLQMVILDTPGLLDPKYELQRSMRAVALRALAEADVIAYVADVADGPPPPLADAARLDTPPRAPVILALNKIDTLTPAQRQYLAADNPDAALISARTGDGIETLLARVGTKLPVSPYLYPDDELSTQSVRFFAAELVRETALEQLEDEVPYSVACEIEEFRENQAPIYIRAVLHVERDSQKAILIGAKGVRIRTIGKAARAKIEALVGAPVYLDLWVKVLANWRRDRNALRRLGYQPEDRAS
jgi:GTP-binding protein Era